MDPSKKASGESLYVTIAVSMLLGCIVTGEAYSWLFLAVYLACAGIELFRALTGRRSTLPKDTIWIFRGILIVIALGAAATFYWQGQREKKKEFLTEGSFCRELLGVAKDETFTLRQMKARRLPLRPRAATGDRFESARRPGAPPVKNLIVVLIDTLHPDTLSCYNPEITTTPVFAQLAAESVLVERAYSTSNWTRAAVATLMTGLYPSEHGITTFDHALAPEADTLAEALRQNGFHTAAFVTNAMVSREYGFQQGFDLFYEAYKDPEVIEQTFPPGSGTAAAGDVRLPIQAPPVDAPRELPRFLPRFDQILPRIDQWLAERPEQRFFCYVHTVDPHEPYSPPEPFLEAMKQRAPEVGQLSNFSFGRYEAGRITPSATDVSRLRHLYQAEVEYTDHYLGKLVERLEQAGALENTLLVIVSDHGEEFYEHAGFLHGWTLHEHQVHIPLLFRAPGRLPAGLREAKRFSLIDLYPTMLAALGFDPGSPSGFGGASWLDSRGRWQPPEARQTIITESDYNFCSSRTVFDGRYKLFYLPRHRRVALYDLAEDRGEVRPRSDEDGQLKARQLYQDLEAWSERCRALVSTVPGPVDADKETLENLRGLGYIGQ